MERILKRIYIYIYTHIVLVSGVKWFSYIYNIHKVKMKVSQSCLTLCDPVDYTVHGIFQARILKWAAFPFSRRSSQPIDWTQVSRIASEFFTSWTTRKPVIYTIIYVNKSTRLRRLSSSNSSSIKKEINMNGNKAAGMS